jgi:hypothetical protein
MVSKDLNLDKNRAFQYTWSEKALYLSSSSLASELEKASCPDLKSFVLA